MHLKYPRSLDRLAVEARCVGAPAVLGQHGSGASRAGIRRLGWLGLALVLGLSTACRSSPEPFDGSVPSLEALGEQVLAALAGNDEATLQRVRLTEVEHNEVVWPELPVSAPEVHFPVDFAWSNIEIRNASALRRIEPLYSRDDPAFVSVDCRGEPQAFVTFEVLTDCWVVFRSGETGELREGQLFKDVLVRGGGYKIFRYYDEAPRANRSVVAE